MQKSNLREQRRPIQQPNRGFWEWLFGGWWA